MKSVVLLSGGMDSTIALYWAMNNPQTTSITTLAIDYGQRHKLELFSAGYISEHAEIHKGGDKIKKHVVVDLVNVLQGRSSILGVYTPVTQYENVEEAVKHNRSDTSYIPARNAVFLSVACNHLLAESPLGGSIVTGFRGRAGEDDGGFPDGSPEFSDDMSNALTTGAFGTINKTKAVVCWDPLNRPGRSRLDALELASVFPGCWEALGRSTTCFSGTEMPCGKCLPCLRRAQGFEQFGKPDPLIERMKGMH